MATKQELLIEANRRGLLTGQKKSSFDEAVRRGIITLPEATSVGPGALGEIPIQAPITEPEADRGALLRSAEGKRIAQERAFEGRPVAGVVEPLLTVGTGAIAEPVSGIRGLIAAPLVGAERAAELVAETQEALTFQPRTEAGQAGLQVVGETIAPIVEPLTGAGKALGDLTFELTGSEALAAGATTLPTLALELIGLGALRQLRSGTRLLDNAGQPTKDLRKALSDQGIVFENLTPEAKESIPQFASRQLLPGGREVRTAAEETVVNQIKSGGRDDALASLKVVDNRLSPDPLGAEAVRQGFDAGSVQAAKTAGAETKSGMKKMLDMTRRIQKNRRLVQEFRPTDIVGDSMGARVNFIRDTANDARGELDRIGRTQLRGQTIDAQAVSDQLTSSLDNLNVDLVPGPGGKPKPVFAGSQIAKDRTSQRIITDVIDLMAEGTPDALRAHNLKRQLDTMIDFRKKGPGGLTEAGRNVLKDIRASLNNSIRDVNPEYAAVNDTLKDSLQTLERFQKVVGPSIDILGEGASKAIGQDLRGLLSNRKTRVELENAVNQVDDVARQLGGVFKDDVKDLVQFGNTLEKRFGAIAETSLKGEIEAVIRRAGQQGVKATAAEAAIGKVAEGAQKLRGINDFNAFESMSDLLK